MRLGGKAEWERRQREAYERDYAVLFERHLEFRPQIKVELSETVVYFAFSITASTACRRASCCDAVRGSCSLIQ